jgi:hypothetical protein
MRLRLTAVLGGIVIAAVAAAPSQAAATGGVGIRLVGTASDVRDQLGRSYVVDRLAPGAVLRRQIEIRNGTDSPVDVTAYAAGANLQQGRFGFAPGHTPDELSSWTSVSRPVVQLPPGARALETVTIRVPSVASMGERYAVVWAEVSAPRSVMGSMTFVNRVGIRMYVSVGPGGLAPGSFTIGRLTAARSATGAPVVVADVRNDGKRPLELAGTLTLSDGPGELRAGPFPARPGTMLAPNASATVAVVLDRRLPRGPWRARLSLGSGFVRRSAEATVTFPRIVANGRHHGSGRVVLVGILLALLAGAASITQRVRRRRGRPTSGEAVAAR